MAAGADVDVRDDALSNAFLALGETGNVAVLDAVLEGRPDVTLTNRFGGTALIPAAERGHVEMVRALLERTDVDVDHVNDLGWTALLEAVVLGSGGPAHQEIVRLLVAAGADRSIGDSEGVTASRARAGEGVRRDRVHPRVRLVASSPARAVGTRPPGATRASY